MLIKKNETLAQFSDRFLKVVSFALILMSISYAAAATAHFVEASYQSILKDIRVIFGLSAAVIVMVPFCKMMYLRIKGGTDCQTEPEGYIAAIYAKSTIISFSVAFIGMVIVEPIFAKSLTDLPPAFVVQAVLAVMMATLGLNFFVRSRENGDEPEDEFDDLEDA